MAISEINFGFKGESMVFKTYENNGANLRTLGACFH